MSAVCPNGHTSEAKDYCDTCGSPIDSTAITPTGAGGPSGVRPAPGQGTSDPAVSGLPTGAPGGGSSLDLGAPAPSPPEAAEQVEAPSGPICPNCGVENIDGALFCEACGYDFTTGAMPRGAGPGPEAVESIEPIESAEAKSAAAWVAEIWVDPDWYATQEAEDPCPSPGLPLIVPLRGGSLLLGRVSSSRNTNPEIDLSTDPGVSRRHAQLTTDGTRWFVEDLDSSNGTFVGPASGPLPTRSIPVGPKHELDEDDRLYVGAWTRVVIREATAEEAHTYA